MKRKETAPDWIAALKDPHAGVRCQAIRALGTMNTVDLMDELVRLTKDSDPEVRCVAVRILAKKGSEEPFSSENSTERAVALLACERALEDRNAGVRATGVVGLNWLGAIDFIPQLQTLLNDPHPEVTYQAGRAVQSLESLRASKAHGRGDSAADPIPPRNPGSK